MGPIIREDDHLFSSLLDLANLRFAPTQPPQNDGINELKSLQTQFNVFSAQHSLADSFAVLGLGGFWNTQLKNKWYDFLNKYLPTCGFELSGIATGLAGDRGIVDVLSSNFSTDPVHPVYFTVHDAKQNSSVVAEYKRPLVYMKSTYLVISLPTTPWDGP
jgi:hypothetical protein